MLQYSTRPFSSAIPVVSQKNNYIGGCHNFEFHADNRELCSDTVNIEQLPLLRTTTTTEDALRYTSVCNKTANIIIYLFYSLSSGLQVEQSSKKSSVDPNELIHGKVLAGGAPQNDKPSAEHIEKVFVTLRETLPKLFIQPLDYSIYHPDLIFENNIRGVRTV